MCVCVYFLSGVCGEVWILVTREFIFDTGCFWLFLYAFIKTWWWISKLRARVLTRNFSRLFCASPFSAANNFLIVRNFMTAFSYDWNTWAMEIQWLSLHNIKNCVEIGISFKSSINIPICHLLGFIPSRYYNVSLVPRKHTRSLPSSMIIRIEQDVLTTIPRNWFK